MKREELNYIFQHAKLEDIKQLHKKIDKKYGVVVINKPTSQTLLVPVKDPISQGEFYAGEALVTSTIVEVNKQKGWSMVQDDNEKISLYIATIDAVFDSKEFENEIKEIYEQTTKKLNKKRKQLNQKVNSTRVSFDLM
jgi:alpha-D-ribose 1-methylphosphonate 5-triphosphate synthase subunit PhnG